MTSVVTSTLVDAFAAAVGAVGGMCTVVSTLEEAARALDQRLAPAARIGLSDAALAGEVAASLVALGRPQPVETDHVFSLDVGMTGAQWGIAETGTLVLDSGRERSRLLSLVPPVHVALLRAADIRPTCAAVLTEAARSLGSALTFITGPSRTSDIELIPVIGVHGPQHLHVVILA